MAARIGDWYAFSRSQFCRTLTLCDRMAWEDDPDTAIGGVLSQAVMASAAPLGGPLAVVSSNVGAPSGTFLAALDDGGVSERSTAALYVGDSDIPNAATGPTGGETRIDVYSNSGVRLGCCWVPVQRTGEVVCLSWTKEEDLCVVTENQLCVFYSLAARQLPTKREKPSQNETYGASGASKSNDPVPTLLPARVFSLLTGEPLSVSLLDLALPGDAALLPVARPGRTTVALVVATGEGVVTVDHQRTVRALLHGDRQAVSALPTVRLPVTPCEVATSERRSGRKGQPPCVVPTALAFVPPDSHDGGEMLLLWATTIGGDAGPSSDAGASSPSPVRGSFVHVAAWPELVKADSAAKAFELGGEGLGDTDLDEDLLDDEVAEDEADHDDASEGDSAAAEKRRRKREKERRRMLKKKKHLQKKRKRAMEAALADGAASGLVPGMLPADKVSIAKAEGRVIALERSPYDASRVAVLTERGRLTVLSTDLSSVHFALDTRVSLRAGTSAPSTPASLDQVMYYLHALAWCGQRFVLLHLSQAGENGALQEGGGSAVACVGGAQPPQDRPFTLLLPLFGQSAVRGERLDWMYDGSSAFVLVPEVDGARVLTDAGCYTVQEVPPALAALCKLQAPFHPARDYLVAYEAYARGRREGFAQVRAVLGAHRSAAEEIFLCLLEAAMAETAKEQQLLFLSAASFVLDTTSCSAQGAERLRDVVTRLRVLAALHCGNADTTTTTGVEGEERNAPPSRYQDAGSGADEASTVAAGAIPLTMGQYAMMAGLYQLHDSEDSSDNEEEKASHVGDSTGALLANRPSRLSHSLIVAPKPITAAEGQVLVDRLLGRRAFQLALQVCRAYGGGVKISHVLGQWACSKIADLPAAAERDDAQNEALKREARVVHDIRQVFSAFPAEASYMDCAAVALGMGRPALAFTLLREEPPSGRKVLMLARAGRLQEAMRTATESGDADLLCLAVTTLLAGCEHSSDSSGVSMTEAVATTLLAFPDALCCLLRASVVRPAWRRAVTAVMLMYTPPPCRWWFAARLGYERLANALAGYGKGELHDVYVALHGDDDGAVDVEAAAEGKKRDKKHKKGKRGSNASAEAEEDFDPDDEVIDVDVVDSERDDDDDDARCPLLPTLYVPKPTLVSTPLCLREEDKQALQKVFGQADNASKQPQALPLPRHVTTDATGAPRLVLLKKVWGLDRAETEAQQQSAGRVQALRAAFGADAVGPAFALRNAIDLAPFSSLAPASAAPAEVLDALQRQRRLEEYQIQFAEAHADTRFVTSAASVSDTVALLAEHGAWAEAEQLRRAFRMDDTKFFMAKFLALCRLGKWERVKQMLGRPPALVAEKRSFFSSPSSKSGEGGEGQPPPCGYEVVVDLLLSYNQHELAADYVPGITADPATRVDWYVNRIGAPVMALEAAYVGEDVGLIRQILQRVPKNAKAQQVGATMIAELESES